MKSPLDETAHRRRHVFHRDEKLSPRSVPDDGNGVYVCLSMALFDRHDQHQGIRSRVWNCFSVKAFGLDLQSLLTHPMDAVHPLPSIRREESFQAWLSQLTLRDKQTLDLELLGGALVTTIKNNAQVGTRSSLHVIAPLVCELYGVGIVLYDANGKNDSDDDDGHTWTPTRTWYPAHAKRDANCVKYIHLLLTREMAVHLLVLTMRGSATDTIPTRVIGRLPLKAKKQSLVNPWDSELIERHKVYQLDVYDATTRSHSTIGPFIAPATGLNPNAQTMHYMRIDARVDKSNLIFTIEGCQKTNQPIYIYTITTAAATKRAGVRRALLIGYWNVDYTSPRISLHNSDESIVIIPSNDPLVAAQRLVAECKCTLINSRPIEGQL